LRSPIMVSTSLGSFFADSVLWASTRIVWPAARS
jgi:hypothetical protein